MEEKNLTDEEIVKALDNDCLVCVYSENCEKCILFDTVCHDFPKEVKNLIHCLQSENAEYKQKIEDGELVSKDWHDEQVGHAELVIAEQKAEIERLKETRLLKENEQLRKDLQRKELLRQKAVLYAEEKQAKIAEIQKQVDELKGNEIAYETRIKNLKDSYEQAVKDTAKEIYEEIDKSDILVVQTQEYGKIKVVPIERLKEIIKSKGVEVE